MVGTRGKAGRGFFLKKRYFCVCASVFPCTQTGLWRSRHCEPRCNRDAWWKMTSHCAIHTHTHWHSRTLSLSAEGHCVFVWRRPPGIIGLCLHVRAFMLAQIRPPVCIILLLLYPFSFLTLTCLMLLFVGFSFWCNKVFFAFVRVSLMFSLKSFSYFLFCFVICFLSLLFILALRPFSYPQWRFCTFMAITLLCFIHIETVQNTRTKIFNIVM